ncbi:lectin-like domain-containing protein [Levilactobacillus enshiensis]|uniref:lectin-like domain-containing protein n=1 Tax=Levilactobacillus enshiensis TaxID=2590213 RepID=UPI00117AA53C|nr:hypothetical protein [Levilactobacillus enshiensis]
MHLGKRAAVVIGVILAGWGWEMEVPTLVGRAATTDPQLIMNSAPRGLRINNKDNNYFKRAAKIGPADHQISNVARALTGPQGDGVMLSQDGVPNTGGAIWSSNKSFNMYQDQRASMWVYLASNNPTPGDGIAFAFQNSSNTAFSGTGESLGVWGVDSGEVGNTTTALRDSAIPKSWALEFDTHVDQVVPTAWSTWAPWTDTVASSFDVGQYDANEDNIFNGMGYGSTTDNDSVKETIKGQHLASNYPAQTDSYYAYSPKGFFQSSESSPNFYGLAHRGLIRNIQGTNILTDGRWHHLTLDYKAPVTDDNTGIVTYSFDDKNPITGAPQGSNNYAKERINLSYLDISKSQPNVYWGLTGATGEHSETSMVVFEQVPGQAKVNAEVGLTDETTGTAITANSQVKGHDQIKAAYKLDYQSGDMDWTDIKSTLKLPANVTWKTGQITYPHATLAKETLDVGAISDKQLAVAVKTLNRDNDQAVITLEGTAENRSASSAATVTSFVGENAIASVTTEPFEVTATPFTVNFESKKVTATSKAILKGRVNTTDRLVTTANTTLRATLSLADGTKKFLDDQIHWVSTANTIGGRDFTLNIPQVPMGNSQVQVTAQSKVATDYQASDTAMLSSGGVNFGDTSGDMVFEETALAGNGSQIIHRNESKGAWRLDVAAGGQWKVTAKTAGLYNAAHRKLAGALIFKTQGSAPTPLSDDDGVDTLISTGQGGANIAKDWQRDTGILLRINSWATSGIYSGTINWTLEVTP